MSASRMAPEDQQQQQQQLLSAAASTTTSPAADPPPAPHGTSPAAANKKKHKGSIDYADQDPDVRSHWALLAAGSNGWYNYRHQADVFHAYQVLLAGGYRRDHIVVMAADDIAQDAENPMPGKVFNAPGAGRERSRVQKAGRSSGGSSSSSAGRPAARQRWDHNASSSDSIMS